MKESIKETLALILTTPQFMFVVDPVADPKGNSLSDYELASRLSYFLWNSLPDDKLLAHAKGQTLRANLESEVLRMLGDEKSRRFSKHFADQWLELGRSKQVVTAFPLDRYYREEFLQETHRFFHEVVRSNGSALEFVDSDYVMVNQNLAHYYGIKGAIRRHVPAGTDRGEFQTWWRVDSRQHPAHQFDRNQVSPHQTRRLARRAHPRLAAAGTLPPACRRSTNSIRSSAGFRWSSSSKLHRDYAACRNCHQKIDPWGLPLESFGADGLFIPRIRNRMSRCCPTRHPSRASMPSRRTSYQRSAKMRRDH